MLEGGADANRSGGTISFYYPSTVQRIVSFVSYTAFWFMIGFLFYKQVWLALCLCPLAWLTARYYGERYMERKKRELTVQFEHFLSGMISALQAGKSVENAMKSSVSDVEHLAVNGKLYLVQELERVNRMVAQSISIERALDDFQRRLSIPEVSEWVEAFRICRRSGGDLVYVMRQTSIVISDKLNMEREIAVTIAGKRFEAQLLSVVPFVLIGALAYGSPDYMEPLYNGIGRLIMTAALALLLLGTTIARNVMRIKL